MPNGLRIPYGKLQSTMYYPIPVVEEPSRVLTQESSSSEYSPVTVPITECGTTAIILI